MSATQATETFTAEDGTEYQLVPVTITMAVALPVEWPKPEERMDHRGPLAKAVYDDLIDKLMDWEPTWTKKWNGEGEDKFTSYSQLYSGEVQSVDVHMGDDYEWGFAARNMEDVLSQQGVYFTMGADGLGLKAESRGEHEGRKPIVPPEALEEWRAER
jgi:hypothetical protein